MLRSKHYSKMLELPTRLLVDNAPEQNKGQSKKLVDSCHVKQSNTEPHSPFQNRAELGIRELKSGVVKKLQRSRSSKSLWDYCAVHQAELRCIIAHVVREGPHMRC